MSPHQTRVQPSDLARLTDHTEEKAVRLFRQDSTLLFVDFDIAISAHEFVRRRMSRQAISSFKSERRPV